MKPDEDYVVKYYLDLEEIDSWVDSYSSMDAIVFQGTPKDPSKHLVSYYIFSNKSNYYNFSSTNNLPMEELDLFEEEVRKINHDFDIGNDNVLDEKELKEYNSLIKEKFLNYFNDNDEKIFTIVRKECSAEGPSGGASVVIGLMPFMWPGWNNQTSYHNNVAIGGVITIYDRIFYRRKLATLVNWGLSGNTCYPSSIDDRLSSCITFSL